MQYSIPSHKLEEVSEKLEKIAKKCAKYNCDFTFEVGEERVRWADYLNERIYDVKPEDDPWHTYHVYPVLYTDIEVEGIAIINGWKFVASVEHTNSGNVIHAIANENIPAKYRTTEPFCDHCGTVRSRKETFIVKNLKSGEFKQVGRSCLKDYTGIDAEGVIAALDALHYLRASDDELRIPIFRYADTKCFLAFCVECVRCFGFTKKSEGGYSTAEQAVDLYTAASSCYPHSRADEKKLEKAREELGFNPEKASEKVEKIVSWLNSLDSEKISEFMHNCKVIANKSLVTFKDFGFLAYIPVAYNREMARRAEIETNSNNPSNYIGKVGDKLIVEVTSAKCVFSGEGFYGASFIYQFTDKAQNVIIWKTSKPLELEDVKTLKGTVKEQKEYKGIKQTVLTRCKVG